MDTPRWIPETITCDWCKTEMPVISVGVLNSGEGIQAWYECSNEDCKHLEVLRKPHQFGINFMKPSYIDAWKKFEEQKEEERKKKEQQPDDSVVPMAQWLKKQR